MRNVICFIFIIFIISSFFICKAESYTFEQVESGTDITSQIMSDIDFDDIKMPNDVKKIIGKDISLFDLFSDDGLKKVWDYAISGIVSPLHFSATLLAAILVCSFFSSVQSTDRLRMPSNFAISLVFACICVPYIVELISSSIESIKSLGVFMYSFIPVFVAVLAIGLRSGVAVGVSPMLFLSAQSIMLFADKIIAPLGSSCVAIGLSSSLASNRLNGLTKGIKKTVIFSISLLATVFLGILTLKTAVFKTADSLGLKTAKFLTGSFIPIVGQSLAEMLSSVISCVGVIKSTVGIYGIVAIILIAIPSILKLIIYKFSIEICATISETLSQNQFSSILRALCDVLTIILAITLMCTVMCIFTVAIVVIGCKSI